MELEYMIALLISSSLRLGYVKPKLLKFNWMSLLRLTMSLMEILTKLVLNYLFLDRRRGVLE